VLGLGDLGWAEVAVLLVLALFVFGPERLPGMAADAGRALRRVRGYLKGMNDDLTAELGPEFRDVDLRSLNPRTFVAKHLLEDLEDEPSPAGAGSRGRTGASGGSAAGTSSRSRTQPDTPLGKDEPAPWDPDTT
jgi:sec-independent protein translocase protein TatB